MNKSFFIFGTYMVAAILRWVRSLGQSEHIFGQTAPPLPQCPSDTGFQVTRHQLERRPTVCIRLLCHGLQTRALSFLIPHMAVVFSRGMRRLVRFFVDVPEGGGGAINLRPSFTQNVRISWDGTLKLCRQTNGWRTGLGPDSKTCLK